MPRTATLDTAITTREIALRLFALACRPVGDPSTETVGIARRDLFDVLDVEGSPVALHATYAALDQLDDNRAPAYRLARHARGANVVLGIVGLDSRIDGGWSEILAATVGPISLREARALVARMDLETSSPLPRDFAPRVSRIIPTAKRCGTCESVKYADDYNTRAGRLLDVCRACTTVAA